MSRLHEPDRQRHADPQPATRDPCRLVGRGYACVPELTGIAAMARTGARIFVGHVFLGGATSQERVRQHLEGLEMLWLVCAAIPPSRPAASWLVAAG